MKGKQTAVRLSTSYPQNVDNLFTPVHMLCVSSIYNTTCMRCGKTAGEMGKTLDFSRKKWIDETNIVYYNWTDVLSGNGTEACILQAGQLSAHQQIICFTLYWWGGVTLWKWHYSRRRDRERKFTASEQEWLLQAEERFWLPEEQREEQN